MRPPRPLVLLAAASLAACVAALSIFKLSNNDIWIHLKTGEYVLTHGWVPIKDTYSFTAADHDYVAHEWLAGVIFHLVHAAGGVNGLIFFKAAVVALAFALLCGTARLLRATLPALLFAAALPLYVASARFIERPHIFSYLFTALYLWLFFRWREAGRRRLWLYAIPPLHIIWTNLHAGYVQGLLLVTVFALGEGLAWARGRSPGVGVEKAPSASEVRLLSALVPACLLASLVNPYGRRLLAFPFELTGMPLFMKEIYEWRPPYDASYNTFTMFVLFLANLFVLFAAFFVAHAGGRDPGPAASGPGVVRTLNRLLLALLAAALLLLTWFWLETPPAHWTPEILAAALYALLGLFALFALVNFRTVDFTQAGIVLLFFILSLRHNRGTADAALATFPVLAASAASLSARRPGGAPRRETAATLGGSVLLLAIAAHALAGGYHYNFRGFVREKGLGLAREIPACALDFAARNRLSGNAFVSYSFAGPLIYRRSPEVKVNMDSRNDVYGEELYREYLDALLSPGAMRAYLARHRIDFFFMSFEDRNAEVFDALDATGDWAPVYYDDRAFILVSRGPGTEDLIRREEFKVIHPAVASAPTRVDRQNAAAALEEAERSIRNCPASRFGWFYKARVLLFLRRHEEAISALSELLARDPGNATAYTDMAQAFAALGRRGEAIAACEKALRIRPGFAPAEARLRELRGE